MVASTFQFSRKWLKFLLLTFQFIHTLTYCKVKKTEFEICEWYFLILCNQSFRKRQQNLIWEWNFRKKVSINEGYRLNVRTYVILPSTKYDGKKCQSYPILGKSTRKLFLKSNHSIFLNCLKKSLGKEVRLLSFKYKWVTKWGRTGNIKSLRRLPDRSQGTFLEFLGAKAMST